VELQAVYNTYDGTPTIWVRKDNAPRLEDVGV
jgi:hypothetical protein